MKKKNAKNKKKSTLAKPGTYVSKSSRSIMMENLKLLQ